MFLPLQFVAGAHQTRRPDEGAGRAGGERCVPEEGVICDALSCDVVICGVTSS